MRKYINNIYIYMIMHIAYRISHIAFAVAIAVAVRILIFIILLQYQRDNLLRILTLTLCSAKSRWGCGIFNSRVDHTLSHHVRARRRITRERRWRKSTRNFARVLFTLDRISLPLASRDITHKGATNLLRRYGRLIPNDAVVGVG